MHKRIRALDGLRGVAILLVLAGHNSFKWGWVGVDLFFCLSGFLITSALLQDRMRPHYWKRFYLRRVTRILPPYLLLMVVCVPAFHLSLRDTWYYYVLSIQNYLVLTPKFVEVLPLGILWSLAIEEQFYLVWPLIIKRCPTRLVLGILIGILLLQPLLRFVYSPFASPDAPYYSTQFHLDGLAAGSLLAVTRYLRWPWAASRALLLSALTIGVAVLGAGILHGWTQTSNTRISNAFLFSALALISVALVALASDGSDSTLNRILSARWLTFFGMISYGLYLCHFPLLLATKQYALAHRHPHIGIWGVCSVPVSVLIAYLSFTYYERPLIVFGKRRADALEMSVPLP